jgi:hypothetical protein
MNLVHTRREDNLTIKKASHLLMVEEIMILYCENHRGHTNAVCVENVQSF